MSKPVSTEMRDLIISRAGADGEIGLVVERILREAGHSTYIQDKDFGSEAFAQRVDEGMRRMDAGASLVGLASAAWLTSDSCQIEARQALAGDPTNSGRRLILLRIDACQPVGLLADLPFIDLEPLRNAPDAFAAAVRGALDPVHFPQDAYFASHFRRTGGQIVHCEVGPSADFTARQAELGAIENALWSKSGKVVLIDGEGKGTAAAGGARGRGGVGKSMLARQYAWQNRARYSGVWWVRARTRDQISSDIAALGARLLPGLDEMPSRAQAVKVTLDAIARSENEHPWLLVYDDAESPEGIAQLTPPAQAHILLTSGGAGWNDQVDVVDVECFPRALAMEYLLAHAHNPDGGAAGRLADELGRLPLALSIARSTSWEMGLDFDGYRALLAGSQGARPDAAGASASLFAVVDIAIQRAVAACPRAEQLLGVAAYLAPDRIPLDIVTPDVMAESERADAAAALAAVSLARRQQLEDGSAGLGVHPLVQAVVRERLDGAAGKAAAYKSLATRLLATAYPEDAEGIASRPACERLNEHARIVSGFAPDDGDGAQWTSLLLNQLGDYQHGCGDFDEAEPLVRRSLAVEEKRAGPEQGEVAARLNNLAQLLAATGRYSEAEPLLRRAVAIDEAAHGAEHPSVARDLGNLALLLQSTGRLPEAEPLMRRGLAIDETAFGPEHPDVAIDLANLASLLKAADRIEEAEPLLRRALAIDEKNFGSEHPSVANSLGSLARLLQDANRLGEAEPVMRRALAISEAAYGVEHPTVATILNNLAILVKDLGRLDEALPLMRRALSISEATFGPEHPSVALKYANFAELMFEAGRPAEADPYIRHAFLTAEKTLGADNPETWAMRASYDKIIAAVDAIARKDDAVEAGLAPAPPERLARPDIPPPPEKAGLIGRIFRRKA